MLELSGATSLSRVQMLCLFETSAVGGPLQYARVIENLSVCLGHALILSAGFSLYLQPIPYRPLSSLAHDLQVYNLMAQEASSLSMASNYSTHFWIFCINN